MLFKKDKPAVFVSKVALEKGYSFMYENFVFSSQHKLFLILKKTDDHIDALQFDFLVYKYGYPNDEVGHPLSKYGLGFYGLFKVSNSPWIAEIVDNNRQHSRHSDSMFVDYQHYIVKFKDVTLEVICNKMEQIQITKTFFLQLVEEQIKFVEV
jgi:hypothetical protein